jgi:hypothetical protein
MRGASQSDLFGSRVNLKGLNFSIFCNQACSDDFSSLSTIDKEDNLFIQDLFKHAQQVQHVSFSFQCQFLEPEEPRYEDLGGGGAAAVDRKSDLANLEESRMSSRSSSFHSMDASELAQYDQVDQALSGGQKTFGITHTLLAMNQAGAHPDSCLCVVSDDWDAIKKQHEFFQTSGMLFQGQVRFFYYRQSDRCLYACYLETTATENGFRSSSIVFIEDSPVADWSLFAASPDLTGLSQDAINAAFIVHCSVQIAGILGESKSDLEPLALKGAQLSNLARQEESETKEETHAGGGAHAGETRQPQITVSLLPTRGMHRQDLQQINLYMLQAYFELYQYAEFSEVLANYRKIPGYLSNAIQGNFKHLSQDQSAVLNHLFSTATLVSLISKQTIGLAGFSRSFSADEICIAFANQYLIGVGAQALNLSDENSEEIINRLIRLRVTDEVLSLGKCWLQMWYTSFFLQGFKQAGIKFSNNPKDVADILMARRLVVFSFAHSEELDQNLFATKKLLNFSGKVYRIQPENPVGHHSFRAVSRSFESSQGGEVPEEGELVELPIPVNLLHNMSNIENDWQQLEQWANLIATHSLWYQVTGQVTVDFGELRQHRQQCSDSALLQAGQVLYLWREFLLDSDRSDTGFYKLLSIQIEEPSVGAAKVYWFYALIQALLGPKNVSNILPNHYDEYKLQRCFNKLQQMLQVEPGVAWRLTVDLCAQCLDLTSQYPLGGTVQFDKSIQLLWDHAKSLDGDQYGVRKYSKWFRASFQLLFPAFLSDISLHTNTARQTITLGQYKKALQDCMDSVIQFLQACIDPYDSEIKSQSALNEFLKTFLLYFYCTVCDIAGLDLSGLHDRGEKHKKLLMTPFIAIYEARDVGDRFGVVSKKKMACFIEFLSYCNHQSFFGIRQGQLKCFAEHLVEYLKPKNSNQSLSLEASEQAQQGRWMRFRPKRYLLDAAYRQPDTTWDRSVEINADSPRRTDDSCWPDFFEFSNLLSGFNLGKISTNNPHGIWMKLLPWYLLAVTITQALFLHANIPVTPSANDSLASKQVDVFLRGAYLNRNRWNSAESVDLLEGYNIEAWPSDVAIGLVALLAVLRIFQSLGGCEKILRKPAVQNIVALMIVLTAISLQGAGQVELMHDVNSTAAEQHLILSNSMFFMMAAGASIDLATRFASIRFVSVVFDFLPRFFYELGLKLWQCHTKEKAQRVRLHIHYVINRLLFAGGLVACIVGACLCFPSFLENLVGTLFGLMAAQYISFAGITSAFLAPGIVFLIILAKSGQLQGIRCNKEMDALGVVELVCTLVVISMIALCITEEGRFVKYQHSTDPIQQAMLLSNSSFIQEKEYADWSGIFVAIVSFVVLALATAWRNGDREPGLGDTRPKDYLRALKNLSCCTKPGRIGPARSLMAGHAGGGSAAADAADPPTERCCDGYCAIM